MVDVNRVASEADRDILKEDGLNTEVEEGQLIVFHV